MVEDELDNITDIIGPDTTATSAAEHIITPNNDNPGDLTREEAEELTASIQSTVTAVYVMLARAHQGRAYRALGYDTWEQYVKDQFDFSVRKSYRLLNLAETVKAIEEAAPTDTPISITITEAQDIKRELPKVTARVKEETAGKTPEESAEIIQTIVDDTRNTPRVADSPAEPAATPDTAPGNTPPEEAPETTEEDVAAALEEEANRILENHPPPKPPEDEDMPEGPIVYGDDGEPLAVISLGDGEENTLENSFTKINLYNLYTFLGNLPNLPDPEVAARIMPPERAWETIKAFRALKEWSETFLTLVDKTPSDEEVDFKQLMEEPGN